MKLHESQGALDDSVRADANKWRKLLATLKELENNTCASIAVDDGHEMVLNAIGDCYGTVEIEIVENN